MPNYLHQAGGNLDGGFPWSITMVSSSSATESAAETAWNSAMTAMFGLSGFAALIPSTQSLTYTSTSTANAAFKQTTKTTTTVSVPGTGGAGLPYQIAAVVTWRSTQATKWGRGRWFLPPLTAAALASGGFLWAATTVTEIVDAVNAAISAWSGILAPQILHRSGTLTGPAADSLTPISAGDVANKPVIQKRRADKLVPTRAELTF